MLRMKYIVSPRKKKGIFSFSGYGRKQARRHRTDFRIYGMIRSEMSRQVKALANTRPPAVPATTRVFRDRGMGCDGGSVFVGGRTGRWAGGLNQGGLYLPCPSAIPAGKGNLNILGFARCERNGPKYHGLPPGSPVIVGIAADADVRGFARRAADFRSRKYPAACRADRRRVFYRQSATGTRRGNVCPCPGRCRIRFGRGDGIRWGICEKTFAGGTGNLLWMLSIDTASFEFSLKAANRTGYREILMLFGLGRGGLSPGLGRVRRGGSVLLYTKLYVTIRAIDFFTVRRNLIITDGSTKFARRTGNMHYQIRLSLPL